MIKHIYVPFALALALILISIQAFAQKSGFKSITTGELETHLAYLASDKMEGRATGEQGLDMAARYLAEQAARIGLKPIDSNQDYYQEYTLVKKVQDQSTSSISITRNNGSVSEVRKPLYCLNAESDTIDLSGELVFAGYGIYSAKDDYNSFENIDLKDKIVLVMSRGPMDHDNGISLLENRDWDDLSTWRYKLNGLAMRMPKAILMVMDPRSGYESIDQYASSMIRYLTRSSSVKELGGRRRSMMPGVAAKILFIHREAADEMLKASGKTLNELQDNIDSSVKPNSFVIPDTRVNVYTRYIKEEKAIPNVAGLIEGSDPELKKEAVVFTAHFDHLGENQRGEIYNGADDNASGTVALIEIGEAFVKQQKDLKRSVLILWFSGEEIGLFGSKFYTDNPLIPLDQTIANINLDMIGAVKTARDTGIIYGEKISVLGMDSIGVIGGHQSTELLDIHNRSTKKMDMASDFSMNSPDHPYRYYYRSDHYNFARNDVPVLFYSTGIHVDYHKPTDNYDRIHFPKLEKVTELAFLVGYKLATQKARIKVDNPYSEW
jgi:hypothetical protein